MNTRPDTLFAWVCAVALLPGVLFGQVKAPTHPHVSYGPEERQWLNLYLPSGSKPAPVFIYAHHNGSTADDVKESWADPTLAEGTAIVSWESIAKVQGPSDFKICAADAKVMFAWVKEHAATYNFDIDKIFIGGQSRGSFVSWELALTPDAGIVGIYMGQALPGKSFNERLLEPITENAFPIFLAYRKEPGVVGDIHDPAHGLRVVERYKELGIGDRAELVHSLNETKDNQVMQFLPQFVRSVVSVFAERPNIIWIEADDLMPRFMNKLGGGFGYTPNLDRLAEEGIHFPNAVCQGVMCGPSRNGLLTNLYSHNLGFYRNGNLKNMPKGVWTFPPVLRDAGYQTAYIGKSHIKSPADNPKATKNEALLGYGFDYVNCTGERYALFSALKKGKDISDVSFIQHLKRRGKYEQFVADNTNQRTLSSMEEDIDYLDGYTTQVAVDWLSKERDTEKPFFLWFNFCLPHGPYNVPQRWFDKVADLDIPPPKTDSFGHEVPEPLLVDNKPIDSEKAAKNRMGEAANVAFMDGMIGKLLDTLEAVGQLENTVIIFFSDHSIFLGNHGRMHKGTLFEEALATSMIVSFPKRFPQDQINPHPMELMDLVPTTFELAGVENPNDIAKNGLSIVPMLGNNVSNGRKFAFSEILGAQSATDARYRYIVSDGVEILYDHKADPWEMENVAHKLPEITERMRQAVEHWMKTSGPIHPPKTF